MTIFLYKKSIWTSAFAPIELIEFSLVIFSVGSANISPINVEKPLYFYVRKRVSWGSTRGSASLLTLYMAFYLPKMSPQIMGPTSTGFISLWLAWKIDTVVQGLNDTIKAN